MRAVGIDGTARIAFSHFDGFVPIMSEVAVSSASSARCAASDGASARAVDWPVLRRYDGRALDKVALPLGGIGTGTVSLGGRGDLRDWEVVNRPAKGFRPREAFFAVRAAAAGHEPVARLLEGPIAPWQVEGADGSTVPHAGLPRFRTADFSTAYPLARVGLHDPALPVEIALEAFNPMIPPDTEASGLPVAVLRWRVRNTGDVALDVSVCGVLSNFVGTDGSAGATIGNRNECRDRAGVSGVHLGSDGAEVGGERTGTLALAVLDESRVSRRTDWSGLTWSGDLLDFWDDFVGDGVLEERTGTRSDPVASVAAANALEPGGEHTVTFLLTWHFPHRVRWRDFVDEPAETRPEDIVGNHYTTRYADAWEVAVDVAGRLVELEAGTVEFTRAVCESTLPASFREAALFTISTLRTQTCFRTADGRFFAWEGMHDRAGSCFGSCTHVWNYEQVTGFLFGPLARSMREVEYAQATGDSGHMSFRVGLPLDGHARDWDLAAADGQMGCLVKLYRDWQLSGDEELLASLWPAARRSLEFAWIPGGWDADRDGVMEGAQHNTMDVEYYGPNPNIACWYLGALEAAARMAAHLGQKDFAQTCRRLAARGRAWVDAHLFNGEYYEQQVRPPGDFARIAPGLARPTDDSDPADPPFQLGNSCTADALTGQYVARLAGLDDVLEPANLRATTAALMRYNFRSDLFGHTNLMRSYALDGDGGLLVATFPRGPVHRPFPYFPEVWTGLEYGVAVNAILGGDTASAERIVSTTRARFDGERRNPYDEAECGHHYARSMAAWGLVVASTGFTYSAVDHVIGFDRATAAVRWVWASGDAWGTLEQQPAADGLASVALRVCRGGVTIDEIRIGAAVAASPAPGTLRRGDTITVTL